MACAWRMAHGGQTLGLAEMQRGPRAALHPTGIKHDFGFSRSHRLVLIDRDDL
jgi:hypothetical protein